MKYNNRLNSAFEFLRDKLSDEQIKELIESQNNMTSLVKFFENLHMLGIVTDTDFQMLSTINHTLTKQQILAQNLIHACANTMMKAVPPNEVVANNHYKKSIFLIEMIGYAVQHPHFLHRIFSSVLRICYIYFTKKDFPEVHNLLNIHWEDLIYRTDCKFYPFSDN